MNRATILALAGLLALAAPAGAKEKRVKKSLPSEIERLASYAPPKAWQAEKEGKADPSIRFSSGPRVIRVRLFGGKGSAHASPDLFLENAAAAGRAPSISGSAAVAGKERPLYRAEYAVGLGDPHERRNPEGMAEEQFVIVPAGRRFFVLSYAYDSAVPAAPGSAEDKDWEAFLASFKLK